MDKALRDRLASGIAQLGLDVSDEQIAALLRYRDMLERWNKAYNLTAIRDPMEMVVRHLLDSLAIAPHLHGHHFVDVGTGPGLPGIPVSIVKPETHWWLLDSNGKKTRFLFQVKSQLGLSNIDIVESRVETWQPGRTFDGVVTRAFADIARTCDQCRHLLASDARLYAMKSQLVGTELSELGDNFELEENIELSVPGLGESRWLTVLGLSPHRG
jgi:16S rRNA (guanine527-N7)-methyltransferase